MSVSSLSVIKQKMMPNFSLPSVLPLSLQPRWLTLGGRGLLGNATGQAFLPGCSPYLCHYISLPISRLNDCSCCYPLPFLSPPLNGDEQKLLKQSFHSNIYPSLLSFSTSCSEPCLFTSLLCVTSWLPAPSGQKKHAGSMLAGSYRVQNCVTPTKPSRHHLALILVGHELRPSQ